MEEKKKPEESALKTNQGIDQPPPVSHEAAERFKAGQMKELPVEKYVEGILSGERVMLGRAITLSESSLPRHQELAQEA